MLLVIKCLGYGGAERLIVDLVRARDAERFDYEVAYVLAGEDALVPAVAADGTPVHSLGARHNWDVGWTRAFRRLLRRGHYDVVHFHLPYAAAMGRLVIASLPRAQRPAVVYTEHSLWGETALPVRALNRATIGGDRALVAVSEAARDALPRSLRGRAEVVVHGVDVGRADELLADRAAVRREVRAELGAADGEVLVLAVANLREEKGYDTLLGAAALLQSRREPVRVAAVGRGPLADELEGRRASLGLDNFRFLGQRSDVLRLLVGSDVFVLASRYEGLPVSLMEAVSAALPVVATRVGGVPSVVTNGREGLLVPPGSPADLADALARVAGDGALRERLGAAAKARSTMFDVHRASRRMEAVYSSLAAP